MEKGIADEEKNLYEQTENVADNVLDSFSEMSPGINIPNIQTGTNFMNIDYNKLFNIMYQAFAKALNSCKLELDEDGFARIVKNELYEVM